MSENTIPPRNGNSKQHNDRNRIGTLVSLWPYVGNYKYRITIALAAIALSTVITLALPMAIRQVIDYGFDSDRPEFIDRYFMILIALAFALAVASSFRYFVVMWIGERIIADLRKDVFAHVTRLDSVFFDRAKSGEIISRLTADTTQIKSVAGASASLALRNLALSIGAVAMMIYTSPKLSGFAMLAIPLVVFPLIAIGRSVKTRSRAAQDTLAEASAYASEAVYSIRTIKDYANEKITGSRFADSVEQAFKSAILSTFTRSVLTGVGIFTVSASIVVVLWIGAQNVLSGTLSAGILSQFVLYSVFAAAALGTLSQLWGEFSQAAGATGRLMELLATPITVKAPPDPATLPIPVTGQIQFKDVSFHYPTMKGVPVLHGIDFSVKSGESLAVVGPTGSGKSTLFNLLMRNYEFDSGKILLDGVSITDADPVMVRKQIAIVPQDSVIFSTTAMENIRFGRMDASDEEVISAAKLSLADEFITSMPHGYESEIGEKGVTISGGQRQRIAIARAILKDSPVLLLDEATSALDAESEQKIQTALERLMTGRTTIVIAHRLSTVLRADRILVMNLGRIVESGTHHSLLAENGLYARLAKIQFNEKSNPHSKTDTV